MVFAAGGGVPEGWVEDYEGCGGWKKGERSMLVFGCAVYVLDAMGLRENMA